MKRKLFLTVWALLLVCLLGIAVYADTVPLPEDYKCEMYYDEEGVACYPESCNEHPHFPKVGDKYVDKNGNVYGTVAELVTCYTENGKIEGYIECVDIYFYPSSWKDRVWIPAVMLN